MKAYILSRLEYVQSVMDGLNKLRDEHDPSKSFNHYWDYLDFIIWIKRNHPNDYELYELETDFEILDEFGDVYVKLIEPARLKFVYRHADGILAIDAPLPKMIKQFYDYVINLQESELAEMRAKSDPGTLTLNDLMNELLAIRADVNNKPNIDTAASAKAIVMEVLSPPKPKKKPTKEEEKEAEITNKMAERKLKMIQNALKQRK
jgi:hypothetical protein